VTDGTTAGKDDIARTRRTRFALADMVRSLGLIVVVSAVLLFIGPARSLILPSSADRYPAIDYSGYARGFADDAHTAAIVPSGLPSSWRANAGDVHSTASATTLHVGWAVPGERFAGLDEGVGEPTAVFTNAISVDTLTTSSTTAIGGRLWAVGKSPRHETVLVGHFGRVLVVITGNATDAELRLLAAALR
jgi:hypothetical protein